MYFKMQEPCIANLNICVSHFIIVNVMDLYLILCDWCVYVTDEEFIAIAELHLLNF